MEKVKVGIVGFCGHTGRTLLRILIHHPEVEITYLADKDSKEFDKSNYSTEQARPLRSGRIYPTQIEENFDPKEASRFADLFFLALPHTVSMLFVDELLKNGKKVIDFSADFRFPNLSIYEEWYQTKHKNPELLSQAVYGLPEIFREEIKKAKLLANPGCYPTATILGILPLLKKGFLKDEIIVDAKSGASGAGKKLSPSSTFSAINENLKPYKVNCHQHAPEIKMILERVAKRTEIDLTFVPHLIPMNKGLLTTIYVSLNQEMGTGEILNLYQKFYSSEPFVKVLGEGEFPQTKDVLGTNYCRIGVTANKNRAIIVSTIDNLMKGAASQAVQNMNIMYGWDETMGSGLNI